MGGVLGLDVGIGLDLGIGLERGEGVAFSGTHPAVLRLSPMTRASESSPRVRVRDAPDTRAENRAENRAEKCPTATD